MMPGAAMILVWKGELKLVYQDCAMIHIVYMPCSGDGDGCVNIC